MRLFTVIISFLALTDGAKILFVSFVNSKSHIGSMLPMAQALSKRGHEVTIYAETYKSMGDFDGIKSHYVILKAPEDDWMMTTFMDIIWTLQPNSKRMVFPHLMGGEALEAAVTQDTFWAVANQTWDLIVSDEVFTPTGYGLALMHAERHGTPHIVFSTTDMLPTFTTMLSLNRNPALAPSYYSGHDEPLVWCSASFLNRFSAARSAIVEYVTIGILSEWVTDRAIRHMGYTDFTWSRYYQTASLVYVDYPDRFAWPIPNGNDLVFVGSFCTGGEGLPKDLEEFVSDPRSKGTIYVAFGTLAHWNYAPKRIIDAYVEALNNLTDYRVIWSYKGEPLPLESHVKVVDWAPQIALLNHPKTRLFVSHGGLKSLKEAICSETPVVYMPFFADQPRTAMIAKQLGFAEYLNKLTVDAPTMIRRVRKVLNDDSYQRSISRQRQFFDDRIAHPLQEGVFWTEKVIRYGRRTVFFKRSGMKQYWFELLYLDWFAVMICALAIVARS